MAVSLEDKPKPIPGEHERPQAANHLALYTHANDSKAFLDAKSLLQRRNIVAAILLTVLLGGLYLLGNGNLAIPLAPFLFAGIVLVLWNYPTMLLPLTLAGACLFETNLYAFADSLTDRVPLFWDINTVFQVYGHVDFHAVPFSLYEIILMMGVVFATVRAVYDRTFHMRGGVLFAPILVYTVCVAGGLMNGLATGGDFHMALFEVRAQFYVLFAYLMAMNNGREPRDMARTSMWVAAVCIGIKGVLLTIRYLITLGGHTNPDLGVGAHEESFFFNAFFVLYVVLKMADVEPQLRRLMLFFLPFVLIANLANERRAATAAMMIGLPILIFLCYVAFPKRRKFITMLVTGFVLVASVYLPAFWNSDGILAQPARAVRSQFDPDPRDQSSDEYRQNEDANLMYTMRSSPIIGYGYGKPIRLETAMVDLTSIDPFILYLTHDQILWVWMRLGSIGFIIFWVMIANFLIRSAQTSSDQTFDTFARGMGVFTAVVVVMLLLFGLFDLQLSNVRDMLFASLWVGLVAGTIRQRAEQEEASRIERMTAMQRRLIPRALHGHVTPQTPGLVRVPQYSRY